MNLSNSKYIFTFCTFSSVKDKTIAEDFSVGRINIWGMMFWTQSNTSHIFSRCVQHPTCSLSLARVFSHFFLILPFNYCYRTAQHAVECSESHLKVCLYISSQDDTGREPWQSIPTHPCVYMCMLTVFIHTTHTAYILCLCQKLQK